jgi:hypothetical protein
MASITGRMRAAFNRSRRGRAVDSEWLVVVDVVFMMVAPCAVACRPFGAVMGESRETTAGYRKPDK